MDVAQSIKIRDFALVKNYSPRTSKSDSEITFNESRNVSRIISENFFGIYWVKVKFEGQKTLKIECFELWFAKYFDLNIEFST